MTIKWIKALGLGIGLASAATFASAQTLKAVTDPSFVPFEMLDQKSGKMIGFDMDILAEVAQRAGFEYDLTTMDFNGIIPALQTRSVDVALAGITITEAREKIVDFSDPYYDSGLRILVRANNDQVNNIDDLKGLKVGTKIGSTSYNFLNEKLGDNSTVTPYPGSSDMYMALMSGAIDAVFYDAPNVGYFASTKGKGRTKTIGPLYEGQQYGIALVSGSPWVEKVNQALAEMKKDGAYKTIYEKWFGPMPQQK